MFALGVRSGVRDSYLSGPMPMRAPALARTTAGPISRAPASPVMVRGFTRPAPPYSVGTEFRGAAPPRQVCAALVRPSRPFLCSV
jgi:hypothetical protein